MPVLRQIPRSEAKADFVLRMCAAMARALRLGYDGCANPFIELAAPEGFSAVDFPGQTRRDIAAPKC